MKKLYTLLNRNCDIKDCGNVAKSFLINTETSKITFICENEIFYRKDEVINND